MKFEFEHALRDLDRKTPDYVQLEIFHHGSQKVKVDAVQTLKSMELRGTAKKLRKMLQITPL